MHLKIFRTMILVGLFSSILSKSVLAERVFGELPDGTPVIMYNLKNDNGMEAEILNYGGIMVSLTAPDKNGNIEDILLGFNNLDDYLTSSPYFGCITGRYGNRIANGRFDVNGVSYQLALNNDPGGIGCSLHGGVKGLDKRIWNVTPVAKANAQGLKFEYTSHDGEEGFPGTLDMTVHYWLNDDNVLRIEYHAVTDKDTIINLTQHNYYNLAGEGSPTINHHELTIFADHFTPVDAGLIPTGELKPVNGTPFDFTEAHQIGSRLGEVNQQLKFGAGYDHNWVLNNQDGGLAKAAELYEPASGRLMEVWTTEPGIQFYGGNFLEGDLVGKSGKNYPHRSGMCLETQHYPDSPNQPKFPSTILKVGEIYETYTEYRFSTR